MSKRTHDQSVTRRTAVKGIVAACVIGSAKTSSADSTTREAATQPSTQPTTTSGVITIDDVAGSDRVAGRAYTDAQHKQMLGTLTSRRKKYAELRAETIDPNVEPAMRFDPRVPGLRLPVGQSSLALATADAIELKGDDLSFATVLQLAPLLRTRKLTSIDLTKNCLDRLKQFGPKLLCVVNLTEERALREAAKADEEIAGGKYRGPLHGIPYGAKDLLAAVGAPTTWGVKPYEGRHFDGDATVIQKLSDAGAVLVAKLSLGELAMGDIWFKGKTRNPWNTDEGSSGSSAGPGASVAAGLLPFAIGSETLGSIVSPCVVCGTSGLRPTWGRVSRFGAMPLCRSMDKLGPMTRGVEDLAIILHAIHGKDDRDLTAADVPFSWDTSSDAKSLRVGIDKLSFDAIKDARHDDVRPIYTSALDTIRKLVRRDLVEVTLPTATHYSGLASLTIAAEAACNFTELLRAAQIDELVQQDEGSWPNAFRAGSTIPASDYLRAQQIRTLLQRDLHDTLKNIDVLLSIPFLGPQSSYTNLTGHPSVVTRCGLLNGRPKMLEFIGPLYREDLPLRLAHAFEQVTDFHTLRPKLVD